MDRCSSSSRKKALSPLYGKEPEAQLFKQLVKANTIIYGTDQNLKNADRHICIDLKNNTNNEKVEEIYASIEAKSKAYFE